MPPDTDIESRITSLMGGDNNVIDQEGNQQGTDSGGESGGTSLVTGGQQSQQPATGTDTDSNVGPQQEQGRQAVNGEQQQVRPRPTDTGDLVDPSNGRIIARAGRDRRIYETQRAVEKAVGPIQQQLETTRAQLQAFREAAQLPTQLGLQPQEVTTAMQFIAHWKRDPVGAAQNMLTELRTLGYDVSGLGSQVDAGALRRMIQDAIAPFQQDREAQRRNAEENAETMREVHNLHAEMPWTQAQHDELAILLQADSSLSLREAALKLQLWAIEHGYNITQPLKAQHAAALERAQNAQQPRQVQNNIARTPGPMGNGAGPMVPRQGSSVGYERSNRSIVAEAMREAGINIS